MFYLYNIYCMLLYFPADAATMKGALVRSLVEVGLLAAVEGCRVDGSLLVFPHKALMIGALLCAGRRCNSQLWIYTRRQISTDQHGSADPHWLMQSFHHVKNASLQTTDHKIMPLNIHCFCYIINNYLKKNCFAIL